MSPLSENWIVYRKLYPKDKSFVYYTEHNYIATSFTDALKYIFNYYIDIRAFMFKYYDYLSFMYSKSWIILGNNQTAYYGDDVFIECVPNKFSYLTKSKLTNRLFNIKIYKFYKINPYPDKSYLVIKYFNHPFIGIKTNDTSANKRHYVVGYKNFPTIYIAKNLFDAFKYWTKLKLKIVKL